MPREDMGGNTGINPYGSNIPAKFRLIKEKQKVFNVDNGKRLVGEIQLTH